MIERLLIAVLLLFAGAIVVFHGIQDWSVVGFVAGVAALALALALVDRLD